MSTKIYFNNNLRKIQDNVENLLTKTSIIILGDEKYFAMLGDNMRANAGLYSSNTPNNVKLQQK